MLGYKYTTETEAIAARQIAADYMGLPVPSGETLFWVNFQYSELDGFYYIQYVEELEKALGEPIEFDVTIPDFI
jgi:hypothetical protein